MKRILKIMAVAFFIVAGSSLQNNVSAQSRDDVSYQTFYDQLSPYGDWIDYPEYGYVWQPRMGDDFRPYSSGGHWVWSDDYEWMWVSDYDWGWAPFHYGRWLYDDMYGWLWIPGYDWSPAWVTWGSVDNFYCWAPLMPGIDVSLQYGSWRPHSFYWNACSRDHIYDRNLSTVIERPERITNVTNRITIINNFSTTKKHNLYFSKGPDVQEVQKYVNHKIDETSIREVNKISQVQHTGNVMNVYRPPVQDPKETIQQHPQQILQPKEFRKAEVEHAKPINTEGQRPVMQRSEQKVNIDRLPVYRSGGNNKSNGGGGGGRRGRS
jgi:hypothetical protein